MTTDIATTNPNTSAAPVSAPVASSETTPLQTPSPLTETALAATPETAPATPAAPEQPAVPTAEPAEESLLGKEPPKEEVKAPETPKDGDKTTEQPDAPPVTGEPKKEEGSQSAEPASLPTYEFTLPEGFQADDTKFGEFKKKIGEFEMESKADHAKFQSFTQDLLNQHTAALQETVERLNGYYAEAVEKQGVDWKDAFEKDPDIGGNRRDTTLKHATQFIRTFGGSDEQQQQLRSLMNETKIGNHPALIRLLANAGEVLAEGKPVPAMRPPSSPQSKVARRYGTAS